MGLFSVNYQNVPGQCVYAKGGLKFRADEDKLRHYFSPILPRISLNDIIGEAVFWSMLPSALAIWIFPILLYFKGILFALILIVKVVGAWFRLYAVNHLDAKLMRDLKQKFFNHLIYLSHKFHSEKKTGSIISRITRGSRSIEVITDVIIFQCCPYYLDFH